VISFCQKQSACVGIQPAQADCFWPGFRNNVSKYFFSVMRHYAYLLAFAAGLPACSQRVTPQQPTFQKPRTVSTIPINTGPNDTVLVF
jgi:hypothetical protein